ncbi:MAG: (2Fe-2S)-binding protein, partial [Myxococcota bacterium]
WPPESQPDDARRANLCLCEGRSDRELRAAVHRGCTTVPDLVRQTGAGSHCGHCKCDLKRLVEEARTARGDESEPELVIAK